MEQFTKLKDELNPVILEIVEDENIGDNVVLFYFASLIKELLKAMDDREIEEGVLTFMFDKW